VPLPDLVPLHRVTGALLAAGALLALAACSPTPPDLAADDKPHGYVEGAAELGEPQLTLATVDAAGGLALLDLLDGSSDALGEIEGATAASTDGRFLYATTPDGVTVVDTGVWTVDHEDHSHYYRAEPAIVGTVPGDGAASVVGGGSTTAVSFARGETVLLDTAALGRGEIVEADRLDAGLVVPFGDALLVAADGSLAVRGADAAAIPCPDPAGTIATRVGVVVGCGDGAVLATRVDDAVTLEAVPYPAAVAVGERAVAFHGRPGRPTVAALAGRAPGGASAVWLLDTRERTWTRLATDTPLLAVTAADDRDGHLVALSTDGRVLTLDGATGATIAATGPLLASTVADPALLAGVTLSVDATRAYVNAPAEGRVYEIDYADGARVARDFEVPGGPLLLAETGRVS